MPLRPNSLRGRRHSALYPAQAFMLSREIQVARGRLFRPGCTPDAQCGGDAFRSTQVTPPTLRNAKHPQICLLTRQDVVREIDAGQLIVEHCDREPITFPIRSRRTAAYISPTISGIRDDEAEQAAPLL